MTREEAIKKLRQMTLPEETREILVALAPELAESWDERIRKELIDMIKECTNWPHKKEYVKYLERQKENPKTADSIPSDCTSDAKCEDRWHKVGDSLPNNGRLVLANDCLGNTLLARYDGEGNWEVSVYDNDDYYCRNTITKWCEIPSEKQKEQHPSSKFNPGDWVVYDGPLGHAILQIKDVAAGRYTFVDNDSTLLEEDSDKFLRPITPNDVEKPAEWSDENYDIISNISNQVYKAIRRTLASLAVYDEDEKLLESKEATLSYYSQQCAEAILKFLRPSWKPSEEQMSMLLAVINEPNNAGAESCYMALKSIYNNLKKL